MSEFPEQPSLLEQARRGDLDALEALLRHYEPVLFGYILRRLEHRQDAEDTLQRTYIRVFKAMKRYREEGHFKAWIFQVAHREVLQVIRSRRRSRLRLVPEVPEPEPAHDSPVQKEPSFRALQEAIDGLPETDQDVLRLRLDGQCTLQEIADILGCPLGTVQARMHRLVGKLRKRLTSELDHA